MKRHVTYPGNRKWYSDHLVELQSESFKVLDAFLGEFGDCIVTGVNVENYNATTHQATLSAGFVSLLCADSVRRVMFYHGGDNVTFKSGEAMNYGESDYYIVPEKTEIIGEYQNPINPVIAEQYSAVVVYSIPVIGGLNVHRTNMPKFNSLFGSVFEPAFNKNSAFNRNFGTTLMTVAQGNHTHSGVY